MVNVKKTIPSKTDSNAEKNDSNAASVFKYWIAAFESVLQAVETGQAAVDPSVEVNRRGLLVKFLTPSVYQYIEDCETYEAAVAELKRVYVKTKNNVFARHLLPTRRQLPGESLQQFLQVLETLSEDYSFRAVTADQYRWELVQDAFINGLASAAVRQTSGEGRSFARSCTRTGLLFGEGTTAVILLFDKCCSF